MPLKYPDVPSLLDSASQVRVAAICDRHLTRAALEPLIEISGFPETGKLFPAHNDWDRRKAVEDHIAHVSQGLMEEMRAEGLLAPCPNNGPRDVAGITAWNAWLAATLHDGAPDQGGTVRKRQGFDARTFEILDPASPLLALHGPGVQKLPPSASTSRPSGGSDIAR